MSSWCSALWDDELEALVLQVSDLFGEHIIAQTIARAFLRQRLSQTGVIPIELFRAAVKAELRTTVRPHDADGDFEEPRENGLTGASQAPNV